MFEVAKGEGHIPAIAQQCLTRLGQLSIEEGCALALHL
jgi:hypothetical protein